MALQKPDFRTISRFRRRHLEGLGNLFDQVSRLCAQAGLARFGHVALDGTKVKANASKHKARSYGRMKTEEARPRTGPRAAAMRLRLRRGGGLICTAHNPLKWATAIG